MRLVDTRPLAVDLNPVATAAPTMLGFRLVDEPRRTGGGRTLLALVLIGPLVTVAMGLALAVPGSPLILYYFHVVP